MLVFWGHVYAAVLAGMAAVAAAEESASKHAHQRKAQAVAAQQERIEHNREDMKFGRWYE
jgi:archaellum component FlaF (FlaF/FlaG flagellin family)